MTAEAYVKGTKLRTDPRHAIGKGGEADIFDIGNGLVLKLFKEPNHPDYAGQPNEQTGARLRLEAHQHKLYDFPRNLPARVVAPIDIATVRNGQRVVGYTMKFLKGAVPLVSYSDKEFRAAGIKDQSVVNIFRDLHSTVRGIHAASVVIGDFNDLNVFVFGEEANILDADSFQFGKYLCHMFTTRFVDPILCDPRETSPSLQKPHNMNSDWYAYAVMLIQCLLFVDPYGGVYRPKNPKQRIPHGARPLKRITIFHPEVKYPGPATPYRVLPDDLLQYFHSVFERDARGEFPVGILDSLRWTKCVECGLIHARNLCPACAHAAPAAVKETLVAHGSVSVRRIFRTAGNIVYAIMENGTLRWMVHENGSFAREDGSVVVQKRLDSHMRFRISGNKTLIGRGGMVEVFAGGVVEKKMVVDNYGGILPVFDANAKHVYWAQGEQLLRDGEHGGDECIGGILSPQTLFWVGPSFGFGFYRAGKLTLGFVFDAERLGLNDGVVIPPIAGQLLDASCVFGKDRAWFMTAVREGSKTVNHCVVIRPNGSIEASAKADAGDGSWLSGIRGMCAVGDSLMVPTDEGVVRAEIVGGRAIVEEKKKFPDTEPFVHAGHRLFAGAGGLYVVTRDEIRHLTIS